MIHIKKRFFEEQNLILFKSLVDFTNQLAFAVNY